MPRAILLLSALVFGAFGFAFAFFPTRMAQFVEIHLGTDVARTDFAATYGGFELGFAAFLAICAAQPAWVRVGLIGSGCALAGFSSVRLIGILLSAEFSPMMLMVLVAEAAGCVVSFWAAGAVVRGRPDGRPLRAS